jgi:hypothetical protein
MSFASDIMQTSLFRYSYGAFDDRFLGNSYDISLIIDVIRAFCEGMGRKVCNEETTPNFLKCLH